MKKLVSLGLATVMALSMAVPTFATELTSANLASEDLDTVAGTLSDVAYNEFEITADSEVEAQGASSVVVLDAEATIFKAVVPIALHVAQAADTTKTYPDAMTEESGGAAKIANLSPMGQIKISDVNVVAAEGYSIVAMDTDFANEKVNSKEFAFVINGFEVDTDGTLKDFEEDTETVIENKYNGEADAILTATLESFEGTLTAEGFPVIANGSILPIAYEAGLPAFSEAVEDANIGAVVFTLDFNTVAAEATETTD